MVSECLSLLPRIRCILACCLLLARASLLRLSALWRDSQLWQAEFQNLLFSLLTLFWRLLSSILDCLGLAKQAAYPCPSPGSKSLLFWAKWLSFLVARGAQNQAAHLQPGCLCLESIKKWCAILFSARELLAAGHALLLWNPSFCVLLGSWTVHIKGLFHLVETWFQFLETSLCTYLLLGASSCLWGTRKLSFFVVDSSFLQF